MSNKPSFSAPFDDSTARSKFDDISNELAQLGSLKDDPTTIGETTTYTEYATGSRSRKTRPLTTDSKTRKTQPITTDVSLPKKAKAAPPKPKGCYWVAEGKGWKLMRSKRDDRGNNPRIASLSAAAWKEIKAAHKSKEERAAALTAWAKARAAEKGIEL